jgi:hypothetical protein
MANLICAYCFVAGPIIWVCNNLTCLLGLSESKTWPFYGAHLALDIADAVIGLGIMLFLVWGGYSLRNLRPDASNLLLTGFSVKLAWSILDFILEMGLSLISELHYTGPARPLSLVTAIAFFMFIVFLIELAFIIVSLVWLRGNRLPTAARVLP